MSPRTVSRRAALLLLCLALTQLPSFGGPQQTSAASQAEQIAQAREAVKQGKLTVEKLQTRLDDPASDYRKAEAEFEAADLKLKEARKAAPKLKAEGKADEAAKVEASLPALQEDWQLAKDRFDLAIKQRKLQVEALANVKVRVAKDQELLDRLEGRRPGMTTAEPAGHAMEAVPGLPLMPGMLAPAVQAPAAPPADAKPAAPTPEDADPAVRKAREEVEARKSDLADAEASARIAEERVRAMERTIKTSGDYLTLEREAVAQGENAVHRLGEALRTRKLDDADKAALQARLADAEKRLAESRDKVKRIVERVAVHTETLATYREEHAEAGREVEGRRKTVEAAEAELNGLLSPFAARNLVRWCSKHVPNLLFILACMAAVHLVLRQFSRQIVRLVARNADRGSEEDRENRAHTLVGVFRYAGGILVVGGGMVMLLDECGIPIVPLMGGAAVFGLAVAFGAQNLIRDYFSGFMMLLEDQYSVNDVVKIGDVTGRVELITLRVTVLRDLEGVRHFIPHGTVNNVSNLTHGWSRAMFDIGVAYKEDVDRVIAVLTQLGKDFRNDPVFGKHVLEDPEMLGVEAFADSAVVVKFLMKTRPLQQWPVKREMLRRIKNKFDELGIEIPFPQRVFHHRFDGPAPAGVLPLGVDAARMAG